MSSPFKTFTGIDEYEFVPGVHIKAIGGEQVLICHVRYEPGKQVTRHGHEHTEQVMYILDGEVTMTIEDETRTLRPATPWSSTAGSSTSCTPRTASRSWRRSRRSRSTTSPTARATSCSAPTAAPRTSSAEPPTKEHLSRWPTS